MTVEYKIIEDKRLVIVKAFGTVTDKEVVDYLEGLAADERYVASMKKLVDFSLTESIKKTYDGALDVAKKKKALESKFSGEKCAFVTPADLAYGMARMHQALMEDAGDRIEVFRRIEEALDWLDVELDVTLQDWLSGK